MWCGVFENRDELDDLERGDSWDVIPRAIRGHPQQMRHLPDSTRQSHPALGEGRLTRPAIAEALQLARRVLADKNGRLASLRNAAQSFSTKTYLLKNGSFSKVAHSISFHRPEEWKFRSQRSEYHFWPARLKQPTFLSRDQEFFGRDLCHRSYCLVWLNVPREENRALRPRAFATSFLPSESDPNGRSCACTLRCYPFLEAYPSRFDNTRIRNEAKRFGSHQRIADFDVADFD